MSKLGSTLKNKRETLGFDIDKVTEETRISADIIDVLEKGEFKSMPSYNHAKNFVKNYAEYLKLELDKVQALFDEECSKEDFMREVKYVTAPVTKEKAAAPSGAKFLIPVLLIALLAFAGYKIFNSMSSGGDAPVVAAEETKQAVDTAVDTPVDKEEVKEVIENIKKDTEKPAEQIEKPAVKKEAEKKQETVKKEAEQPAETSQKIKEEEAALSAFLPDVQDEPLADAKTAVVNFSDVCWVHIKIDDKEEMDFIAERGNQREIVFHDHFIMDIGNAAVVSVSYNNRTIAGLGAYKQPVKGLKFTVNSSDRLTYTSVK